MCSMKVLVIQSGPTLCKPIDCSPPGSSIHGILQARILGWVAISFSRGSSPPRDWTQISCIVCWFSSVQSLSPVRLFATPGISAHQASLSITNSQSSLKLMSIKSVMPSSHLILCRPVFLLPSIPPSIRVFSNESTLPNIRVPEKEEKKKGYEKIYEEIIVENVHNLEKKISIKSKRHRQSHTG